ncbi:hypothetical protein IEO21_09570 [Rhodonia placenta]|uniref:Uncharacterized protein n=1 Tax=Rhodonia placenta TaxID=104341 RepID=A0A8H7NUI5_9APHY|nr:hypothetical protein IEO21_09570 [Postia placenta]
MRPTLVRLVRILPRNQLAQEQIIRVKPLPEPVRSDVRPPSLIEVLLKRKEVAGSDYPSNIRIEPPLTKASYKGVPTEIRADLREVVRER